MQTEIVCIGAGNVAWHICTALQRSGCTVVQIVSKTQDRASELAGQLGCKWTTEWNDLYPHAVYYLIAVPDDAIEQVSEHLTHVQGVVLHTSGSTDLDVLRACSKYGVLYPFQTFSRQKTVDFEQVPVCIEAKDADTLKKLSFLAGCLTKNIVELNSVQRRQLHLAAVFGSNFVNHMLAISYRLLAEKGISKTLLEPLIRETIEKALTHLPGNVQTGPAVRNDFITMQRHIEDLQTAREWRAIYKMLSGSIQDMNNKKDPFMNKKFKTDDLTHIKAFVFDVDGVFSKSMWLNSSGELMRDMNTKDGYAVKHAVDKGFPVAIITGGDSDAVRKRFLGLGVTDVYIRSYDKLEDFEDFISKYGILPEEVLYMGDDMPDYEVMKHVGFPSCPQDAAPEIVAISKHVSEHGAGQGCVRDVIESVMKSQGKWLDSTLDD